MTAKELIRLLRAIPPRTKIYIQTYTDEDGFVYNITTGVMQITKTETETSAKGSYIIDYSPY